jgi:hypothetical protein
LKNASKLRLAGALGAIVALGALTAGGTAAAGVSSKGLTETIKIKNNDHPKFVGPDVVSAGSELQIVNRTDPNAIGPHTFSLVTKDQLPKGREEIKKCGKQFRKVCGDIAEAHEVNFNTGEVNKPVVDNGLPSSWDASFDGDSAGDSWFTLSKDESHARQVGAAPGEKLFYMCAVHPFMQGKLEVGPVR